MIKALTRGVAAAVLAAGALMVPGAVARAESGTGDVGAQGYGQSCRTIDHGRFCADIKGTPGATGTIGAGYWRTGGHEPIDVAVGWRTVGSQKNHLTDYITLYPGQSTGTHTWKTHLGPGCIQAVLYVFDTGKTYVAEEDSGCPWDS